MTPAHNVYVYNKNAPVCPLCKLDANSFPRNFNPYHRTETKLLQGKPSVYISEPSMVNPNFIEAVKTILEHVSTTSQLSENHDSCKWTFVISDGVPYVHASTIQDSLQCTVCEEYIDSSDKDIHHHHTRQILWACLYALLKELLVSFARDCLKAEIIPNNKNYINWVVETCGYQYMLYYHFAFTSLLPFDLYTEATCKNHSLRMMAAQIQFVPVFYSFKHPKYQVLHLQDLFERAQMPDEIRSYVESHESFSPWGLQNCGQGGDFVQEESNRLIKLLLPPGVPSQEIWTCVCGKAKTLKHWCAR